MILEQLEEHQKMTKDTIQRYNQPVVKRPHTSVDFNEFTEIAMEQYIHLLKISNLGISITLHSNESRFYSNTIV
jgi:hypothetical protein